MITKPNVAIGDLIMLIKWASRDLGYDSPPISSLTLPMIKADGKPPKLKTKAAEGRYLLPVVVAILEKWFPARDDHEGNRLLCLTALRDMYTELKAWGPGSGPRVASLGRRHVLLYEALSRDALSKLREGATQLFWRLYPKHHLFIHCVEDQVMISGNIGESWNYRDESAIGDAAKVAGRLHPRTLHRTLITKMRVGPLFFFKKNFIYIIYISYIYHIYIYV